MVTYMILRWCSSSWLLIKDQAHDVLEYLVRIICVKKQNLTNKVLRPRGLSWSSCRHTDFADLIQQQQKEHKHLTEVYAQLFYITYKAKFIPRQDGGYRASVFTS
ncbi:hypothetical protein HanIR_Chr13g0624711 [Helianthus annuus]|nr:hypothetical protein HanIR_Chr13g0624711 [Helianthus annuus]